MELSERMHEWVTEPIGDTAYSDPYGNRPPEEDGEDAWLGWYEETMERLRDNETDGGYWMVMDYASDSLHNAVYHATRRTATDEKP
jgi:hypothetical protein